MAVSDVLVGSDGVAYYAPEGAALPTNAGTALDVAFVDLGEISQDGLESAFDVSSEGIKNWAGETVRIVNTETTATFTLTFLETNEDVIALFYGADVESQLGDYSRVKLAAADSTAYAMAISVTDSGTDRIKRYVLPRVTVSAREPVMDKNDQAAAFKVTFTALYDTVVGGYGYVQFDDDLTS